MKYYHTTFSSNDISKMSSKDEGLHFDSIKYCGHDVEGKYGLSENAIKLILIEFSEKGHLMGVGNFTLDEDEMKTFHSGILKVLEPAVERRAALYQRFSKGRSVEETRYLLRKFRSIRPEDQALMENIYGSDFEYLKLMIRELPNFISVLGRDIICFTRVLDGDDFLIEGLNKLLSIIDDCLERKCPLYVFEKVTD
jgi:hypothetical protein